MNARLLCAAILLIVLLALSGCPLGSTSLPANWPIPQLSLPPGAKLTALPSVGNQTPTCRANSAARFSYTGSWDDVAGHIEQCLAPLGYVEYVEVFPGGDTMQHRIRYYWAPDDRTSVLLSQASGSGRPQATLTVLEHYQSQGKIGSDGAVYGKGIRVEIRPLQAPNSASQ
jgi:hypothetical protein